MDDLVAQLERRAGRGEVRGGRIVFRDAQVQTRREPEVGRRRLPALVAAVVAVIVGGIALGALGGDATQPELRIVGGTADALSSEGTGSALIWTAGEALFRGDPETGEIRRLADLGHNCGTCPIVRAEDSLFVGDENGLQRLDGSDQAVRRIASGDIVFPSTEDGELFVAKRSSTSPHGSDLALIDIDGAVLGGPWQLPDGYALTSPARATSRGLVVRSPTGGLALWNPLSDSVAGTFGTGGLIIDTFTAADRSLVARTSGSCSPTECHLSIRDVEAGTTTEIPAPEGLSGFLGGGAFSPDGSNLAAFGTLDRGAVGGGAGRRMQLVIVDVTSGEATGISKSVDEFGEGYGFATWSRTGRWLFFGGLRMTYLHRIGTHDAIALALPPEYSVIAVDESF